MSNGTSRDVPRFSPRKRRMSAPPLNFQDLRDMNGRQFYWRTEEIEGLFLDPKDMANFSTFDCIRNGPQTSIFLSNEKVLKTYSYLVDVSEIVANMELARTKIPVPRVYKHGYSGNSGYILMERVRGHTLSNALRNYKCPVPNVITSQIKKIIEDLASLSLCHNDIKPRNIVIDLSGDVLAICRLGPLYATYTWRGVRLQGDIDGT
ncbi:hypothetical protein L218DRAFT_998681 [Marasmius fiardii PR-910]|nr:hypothetical protein L218DRAFT_998681 [Marasmius fiardii PR-910]